MNHSTAAAFPIGTQHQQSESNPKRSSLRKGTFTMFRPRPLLAVVLLAAAVGFGSAPMASAQIVQATAQRIQVVDNGDGHINLQFRITVTNGESAVASDVYVEFEDGSRVYVGDVPAGGSAVSAPQTQTFDISQWPSQHIPFKVFVTFQLGGKNVELEQLLSVVRTAPEGILANPIATGEGL